MFSHWIYNRHVKGRDIIRDRNIIRCVRRIFPLWLLPKYIILVFCTRIYTHKWNKSARLKRHGSVPLKSVQDSISFISFILIEMQSSIWNIRSGKVPICLSYLGQGNKRLIKNSISFVPTWKRGVPTCIYFGILFDTCCT